MHHGVSEAEREGCFVNPHISPHMTSFLCALLVLTDLDINSPHLNITAFKQLVHVNYMHVSAVPVNTLLHISSPPLSLFLPFSLSFLFHFSFVLMYSTILVTQLTSPLTLTVVGCIKVSMCVSVDHLLSLSLVACPYWLNSCSN